MKKNILVVITLVSALFLAGCSEAPVNDDGGFGEQTVAQVEQELGLPLPAGSSVYSFLDNDSGYYDVTFFVGELTKEEAESFYVDAFANAGFADSRPWSMNSAPGQGEVRSATYTKDGKVYAIFVKEKDGKPLVNLVRQ